ncbi:GumC family protein [Edaphobacter modestus]|uniref:non-specific protein-tyrosine kinase n=1 Tax=Edaphobacter modestus TaxID=388466 RepID=A0A4Q7YNP3_9BACT|nr:polysaccharide biosynthesis tyrosine autokinase [Edaphobacter modestus]RZU38968.1 capsular exopolysaccharide synthesis family protein [Edaphobacter modestus]
MGNTFNTNGIDRRPVGIVARDESGETFPKSWTANDRVEQRTSLFAEYLRILSRHRWMIFASAIAGILLSFLLSFASLPYYRARTSLDIQSLNSDFMNMRAVAPTGEGNGSSAETNVQTQIKLLQSDTLLQRTKARLAAEPHSATTPRLDLASRLIGMLHLPISVGKPISSDDLIEDTAKHVTVKPLGITRLVEITCDSWNAEFAARFCNTLTTQFKEADLETRSSESEKTSRWLAQQAADIKLLAEESQHKLEAATGGNGLVLSQESTTVGEDKLRELQAELVRAQADRIQKESQSEIAAVALSTTLPSVMDSPEYRRYQEKLADLKGKVAQLVPPLTEENPKVIHLRSEIREVEAGMEAARNANSNRLKNELETARHREMLLMTAYHMQEANVSSDLGKAAQVSLLRREVESEQQLYQTLLQRAKEAGFASAMQASTVRLVDAAHKPKMPFSPRRGTSTMAGLLLGSLFGIGFAFYKDRNSDILRVPGEVERYLNLNELGVIPSSRYEDKAFPASRSDSIITLQSGSSTIVRNADVLDMAGWSSHFSVVAEAYRSTTFSILLTGNSSNRARVYVVTSPNAGDGKTTVTSNLGVALSKSNLRVVILDGDLRKPGMHNALHVPNDVGLRNLLRGEIDLARATIGTFCKATRIPNLSVIPSGSGSEEVVQLLHSPRLAELIDRLHREFDVVLIDTPPMLHMADARIFACYSQGAILVIRSGSTSREQATKARDFFDKDRVRLIGTILNAFDPGRERLSKYYDSYYRYKQEAETFQKAATGS